MKNVFAAMLVLIVLLFWAAHDAYASRTHQKSTQTLKGSDREQF